MIVDQGMLCGRRDRTQRSDHPEMTVNAWFGADGEFLLLPLAKDVEYARSEVNLPERLRWDGASVSELGERVLECLAVSAASIGHLRETTVPSLLAAGVKSYRAFAKTRHMVDVAVPEGGGCLVVQFWPRNASFMFVGPPRDRTDLTITLPEDATPEQVGSAVVRVLQAGGVDITGQPGFTGGPAAADSDSIGYAEFKAGLVSDYELTSAEYDTATEAITGLLDRVGRTIGEDPRLFHCAITTCALICLKQGFLPDYLDQPVRGLGDISDQLSGDDLVVYRQDVAMLRERLAAGPRIVEAPCPPDYFPDTWGISQAASEAWWNGLLAGTLPASQ